MAALVYLACTRYVVYVRLTYSAFAATVAYVRADEDKERRRAASLPVRD